MSKFNFNTEKGFWEWDMGNDEFMVFLERPVFSIETRNNYKEDFKNVLKQLTDKKQKILSDKIVYDTGGRIQNTDFEWYRKLVQTEKTDFSDFEAVRALKEKVNVIHHNNFFSRYNGIMKVCPLDIEIMGDIGKDPIYKMVDYKNILDGYKYNLCCYLKITLKRTMDLRSKLGDFEKMINKTEYGDLNVSLYSKYDDLYSEVMFRYKSFMNNNFCDRLNFLGDKYTHTENSIGYECYNGDKNLLYIDVLYSRCGVNKKGNPLPNRIYKKNSSETIDSPWSHMGQADYLRTLCKENKIKKYSKMNKKEMVKKLIAL